MSKKIIYLLSLLMALSLVFASCKKNGITGVQGNFNKENETHNTTGGLIETWDDLQKYNTTPVNDYAVIGEEANDYYRNPVIVALGGGNVLVVAERRINYPGSDNDIGVNGEMPVDIVYLLSTDGGDIFGERKTIGQTSEGNDPGKNAVSAPVVYYKDEGNGNGKIYIIASAGSGISRTATAYNQRTVQSKLKYAVGTVTGAKKDSQASVSFAEGFQDLTTSDVSLLNGKQFGTHSARGVINGDNLLLPVITAEQGVNSSPKEMMGVLFCKVEPNSSFKVTAISSKVVDFPQGTKTSFSKYKETRAVEWDGNSTIVSLSVPSPDSGDGYMGKGDANNTPTSLKVQGSEGSPGFLKLDASSKPWFGDGEYDPSKYASEPASAGAASVSPQSAILFSHVKQRTGQNYLHLLDSSTYTAEVGSDEFVIAKTSKSSSIDVLEDGTIIMAVEKEKNPNASGNKFNIFFSRYTQAYLASKLLPQ